MTQDDRDDLVFRVLFAAVVLFAVATLIAGAWKLLRSPYG